MNENLTADSSGSFCAAASTAAMAAWASSLSAGAVGGFVFLPLEVARALGARGATGLDADEGVAALGFLSPTAFFLLLGPASSSSSPRSTTFISRSLFFVLPPDAGAAGACFDGCTTILAPCCFFLLFFVFLLPLSPSSSLLSTICTSSSSSEELFFRSCISTSSSDSTSSSSDSTMAFLRGRLLGPPFSAGSVLAGPCAGGLPAAAADGPPPSSLKYLDFLVSGPPSSLEAPPPFCVAFFSVGDAPFLTGDLGLFGVTTILPSFLSFGGGAALPPPGLVRNLRMSMQEKVPRVREGWVQDDKLSFKTVIKL
mmetsp:Transcript_20766/g.57896  ORF Transcript_20766/g.57896 Transcript_20766/m.57896 type:complete len:312 (-) Transcript_20766:51-986(-)